MSVVERTLRDDPAGVYAAHGLRHARPLPPRASSASRKRSDVREAEVARAALAACAGGSGSRRRRRARQRTSATTWSTTGLPQLEQRARHRAAPPLERVRRHARAARRSPLYLGSIALLTALFARQPRRSMRTTAARSDGCSRCAVVLAALVREPARGRARQLARDAAGDAARVAAHGFRDGIPPDARTLVVVPTMLVDARDGRGAGRGARGALPGQPRRAPALRAADRLPRRAAEQRCRATTPLLELAAQRIDELNENATARDDASSCCTGRAAGTPRERRLDGLRAQARQARRPQRAAARRRARSASRASSATSTCSADVRYVITLDTDTQLPRDAARAARRRDGASAEPRRATTPSAGASTEGYGILQPRVAVSLPGADALAVRAAVRRRGRASTRTRAPCPTSTRTCSAKARSSARASTTSMPSSRRCGDRFPENRILSHDLLEGCYARSGLLSDVELFEDYPVALPGRREPAPSLDPRRLADRELAAAGACRASAGARERNPLSAACRSGRSSTTCAAASCRRALTLLLLLGWVAAGAARAAGRSSRSASCVVPGARRDVARSSSRSAGRRCWRQHLRAARRLDRHADCCRRCSRSRRCRTRRSSASTRSCARRSRIARDAPPAAASGRPPATRARRARRALRGVYARDVRSRRCSPSRSAVALAALQPRALPVAAPILVLWLASPLVAWWLSRPLRARAAAARSRSDTRVPAHDRAPDLALLRDVRRARGQLAAAGQRPGEPRRRSSRIARRRPTSACRCSRTSPRTTSATSRPASLIERTARTFEHAANDWSASAGTSSTGTTRARSSRCGRATSRRSTAATSPGTCSRCDRACVALVDAPILHRRWLAGLADTLAVLREPCDGDRVGIVGRIDDALRNAARAIHRARCGRCARLPRRHRSAVRRAIGRADDQHGGAAVAARRWNASVSDALDELDAARAMEQCARSATLRERRSVDGRADARRGRSACLDGVADRRGGDRSGARPPSARSLATFAEHVRRRSERAIERIATIDRLAARRSTRWRPSTTTSCTTGAATCWRSATT